MALPGSQLLLYEPSGSLEVLDNYTTAGKISSVLETWHVQNSILHSALLANSSP
jgi:hypothetical protein